MVKYANHTVHEVKTTCEKAMPCMSCHRDASDVDQIYIKKQNNKQLHVSKLNE